MITKFVKEALLDLISADERYDEAEIIKDFAGKDRVVKIRLIK